jgi:hypothetical protein
MDADAHRQFSPFSLLQASVERHGNGLDNPHTRMQDTLGIIFVSYWRAEREAQVIPAVLGHSKAHRCDEPISPPIHGLNELWVLGRIVQHSSESSNTSVHYRLSDRRRGPDHFEQRVSRN